MTEVPTTENMRWLLANAGPEIGWPEQAFKALVDITKVCEIIESQGLLRTADDGWHPIETAPKDGDILLYDCGVIWVGCFQKVGGQLPWFTYQFDGELQQATHWMPLPQPPQEKDHD